MTVSRAGITLLRSPAYAHHDPYELQTDKHPRYTDQGEHAFVVRIWPGLHLSCEDVDSVLTDMVQPVLVWDDRGG